jgi:Transmembrane secretion effector
MNLAGIIGPAIGGFLIPLVGVSSVFAMNALAFVLVLFAVMTWKRESEVLDTPLESFFDSLAGAVRYIRRFSFLFLRWPELPGQFLPRSFGWLANGSYRIGSEAG